MPYHIHRCIGFVFQRMTRVTTGVIYLHMYQQTTKITTPSITSATSSTVLSSSTANTKEADDVSSLTMGRTMRTSGGIRIIR
jgi:hypothetical protein